MRRYARFPAALAVLALVLPSACSDSGGGVTDPPFSPPPAGDQAKGTVGSDGGTVGFDDGRFKLIIPAGALGNDTEITITELSGDDIPEALRDPSVLEVYDLRPDGLQFAVPAEAVAHTEGSPAPPDGAPLVGLVSLSQDSPELLGPLTQTVDSAGITSSAPVGHFSQVAKVEPLGLIMSLDVEPASLPVEDAFDVTLEAFTEVESDGDATITPAITAIPEGVVSLPAAFDQPSFVLEPGKTQEITRTATGTCEGVDRAFVDVDFQTSAGAALMPEVFRSGGDLVLVYALQVAVNCTEATSASGSIGGTVTVNGQTAGGIEVAISGTETGNTVTASDGTYSFTELTPGDYDVVVTCPAGTDADAPLKSVFLTSGQTETVDFACSSTPPPSSSTVQIVTNAQGGDQLEVMCYDRTTGTIGTPTTVDAGAPVFEVTYVPELDRYFVMTQDGMSIYEPGDLPTECLIQLVKSTAFPDMTAVGQRPGVVVPGTPIVAYQNTLAGNEVRFFQGMMTGDVVQLPSAPVFATGGGLGFSVEDITIGLVTGSPNQFTAVYTTDDVKAGNWTAGDPAQISGVFDWATGASATYVIGAGTATQSFRVDLATRTLVGIGSPLSTPALGGSKSVGSCVFGLPQSGGDIPAFTVAGDGRLSDAGTVPILDAAFVNDMEAAGADLLTFTADLGGGLSAVGIVRVAGTCLAAAEPTIRTLGLTGLVEAAVRAVF